MYYYYKVENAKVEITNSNYELQDGWIKYTVGEEPQVLLDYLSEQKDKTKKLMAVMEAKAYLASTDYKMLPNYVPKPDEDLDAIVVKRNETREFIRNYNA